MYEQRSISRSGTVGPTNFVLTTYARSALQGLLWCYVYTLSEVCFPKGWQARNHRILWVAIYRIRAVLTTRDARKIAIFPVGNDIDLKHRLTTNYYDLQHIFQVLINLHCQKSTRKHLHRLVLFWFLKTNMRNIASGWVRSRFDQSPTQKSVLVLWRALLCWRLVKSWPHLCFYCTGLQ